MLRRDRQHDPTDEQFPAQRGPQARASAHSRIVRLQAIPPAPFKLLHSRLSKGWRILVGQDRQ